MSKRGPGRPKLKKSEAKGHTLSIRLTSDEKSAYEKNAANDGLTLAAWIRLALQTSAQHGIKKNGAPGN